MRKIVVMAAAMLGVAINARAAELASKQVLTLEGANKMIAAAQAEATRNGWPCVVAVVSTSAVTMTREAPAPTTPSTMP